MGLKLSEIKKSLKRFFERKKKNPILYGNDSVLDPDLKPFRIGQKQTIVELSDSELKVRGTIDADAISVNGASVQTGDEVGAVTAINNAAADRLVTIGATTTELEGEAGLTFSSSTGILTIESDEILHPQLKLTHAGTDYFSIDALLNGGVKIKTFDSDATIGHMELESDGTMTLDADDDFTLDCEGVVILDANTTGIHLDKGGTRFGTLNMATGSHLKLIATDNYGLSLVSGGTGDITFDSNGDIIVDSADGNFIAKKAGTEFSAANSSYAGMILAYSVYRNATGGPGNEVITIGTTMTVLETADGNKINVSFVAPPSGKVEIIFSAIMLASSREVMFSLSDNASYNEVDPIHTYDHYGIKPDETDYVSVYMPFVVQGLTAGTSYQYWIAGDSSSASSYLYHGVDRTESVSSQPITFKAIALPATIVSEE